MGMTQEESLTIGAVSRQTGVNVETIRYYERIGLLPCPQRSNSGYRVFRRGDVTRLSFVRRARDLGFSLDQVKALLGLAHGRRRSCRAVQAVATAHLGEVRAKMADLRRLERVLQDMVARCGEGAMPGCPLIDALLADNGAVEAREKRSRAVA